MPFSHAEAPRRQSPGRGSGPAKAGFSILRQGRHIIMSNGERKLVVPRNNPVNAITMGGIVRDAGMTNEEFRKLL